ncbi:hypothetical protein EAF04_002538 [Stromatinia cepivora]|nr:hypothetical protein EAF04_002538 [Stromatinia cepivora]
MPHITTAMEWSRRRGIGEILVGSFLRKRSITGEESNVKESFSSWSNCMAATYCKWPVIAAIIIVGLIVFSIVWCIIRCACCGMSCCCTCFSFLKCCDCCGGCCDGKRDRPHKHLDDFPPPNPNPNQGYQAPAPMMGGALPARPEPPKYAQFEVGKNGLAVGPPKTVSEDALPPMPTWENASKKHVNDEEKSEMGMELKELDPVTGQKMPLMAGGVTKNHPNSPAYGQGESAYRRQGHGMNNVFMNSQGSYSQSQNNLAGNGRGFGPGGSPNPGLAIDPLMGYRGTPPPIAPASQLDGMGYRGTLVPGSAMAMGEAGMGYRGTPPPDNLGPGQYRGEPSPAPSRGYGESPPNQDFEPAMPQEFPFNSGFNDTPVSGYAQAEPMYDNRSYPSQPSRQFSNDSSRSLNPERSYTNNTDQSYQPYQSDNSSNIGTYPPPLMPSSGTGQNGPNRVISPSPQNGNYGGLQQRGFNNHSPAQQQQPMFGQGQGQGQNDYDHNAQRNITRSPPQQQETSAFPGYRPYVPEPKTPAYPGYKPYKPAPRY